MNNEKQTKTPKLEISAYDMGQLKNYAKRRKGEEYFEIEELFDLLDSIAAEAEDDEYLPELEMKTENYVFPSHKHCLVAKIMTDNVVKDDWQAIPGSYLALVTNASMHTWVYMVPDVIPEEQFSRWCLSIFTDSDGKSSAVIDYKYWTDWDAMLEERANQERHVYVVDLDTEKEIWIGEPKQTDEISTVTKWRKKKDTKTTSYGVYGDGMLVRETLIKPTTTGEPLHE